MRISDLPTGPCSVTLSLRRGEEIKAKGKIVYSRDGKKHFIVHESPRVSYAPNTQVLRHRTIAKLTKTPKR